MGKNLKHCKRCACGAKFVDEKSLRRHIYPYGRVDCRNALKEQGYDVPEFAKREQDVVRYSFNAIPLNEIMKRTKLGKERVLQIIKTFGGVKCELPRLDRTPSDGSEDSEDHSE